MALYALFRRERTTDGPNAIFVLAEDEWAARTMAVTHAEGLLAVDASVWEDEAHGSWAYLWAKESEDKLFFVSHASGARDVENTAGVVWMGT